MGGIHHLDGDAVHVLLVFDHTVHTVIARFAIEDGLLAVAGKPGNGFISLEVAHGLDVLVIIVGEEKQVNITRSLAADDS